MRVKGMQAVAEFDGQTVVITKKQPGSPPRVTRIDVGHIAAVTHKSATLLFHGYIAFHAAGTVAAPEQSGLAFGGRPPHSDPNSLSIPRRSNTDAAQLVQAVEAARQRLSP